MMPIHFLFGTGTDERYIFAHSIARIPRIHWMQYRIYFDYKGEPTAWKLWMKENDATKAFTHLSEPQTHLEDESQKSQRLD